jgi:hypothetical protein
MAREHNRKSARFVNQKSPPDRTEKQSEQRRIIHDAKRDAIQRHGRGFTAHLAHHLFLVVRFHPRQDTKPLPFVNAQFLAQNRGFLHDLRDIVRKITAPQPLILQGKQTFFIFSLDSGCVFVHIRFAN